MPELPEVETVRRGLERALVGKTIERVELRRPDLRWPFPDRMPERLAGSRVERADRMGKYILLGLSTDDTLIVHLGMSGSFREFSPTEDGEFGADPHDHVLLWLDGDCRIAYNDPRRFGMMDLASSVDIRAHRLLAAMGPEPLGNSFNGSSLHQAVGKRKSAIKTVLLDQKIVAGLGNIYASEALWHARIRPDRRAASLSPGEANDLALAIRRVLKAAIDAGGSSLRDHHLLSGETGYFQHSFRVYGRESEACPRNDCPGKISRMVQAGRSTFLCTDCQG